MVIVRTNIFEIKNKSQCQLVQSYFAYKRKSTLKHQTALKYRSLLQKNVMFYHTATCLQAKRLLQFIIQILVQLVLEGK